MMRAWSLTCTFNRILSHKATLDLAANEERPFPLGLSKASVVLILGASLVWAFSGFAAKRS